MAEEGRGKDKPLGMEACLHARQAFAGFKAESVPEESLDRVLELARLSPTEWYFQPWRWIVVRNGAGKQHLESSTHLEVPLASAPIVLICLADTGAWKTAPLQ